MANEDDLREQVADSVPDDVYLFKSDGDIWGKDDRGEFRIKPMGGSEEPRDDRCGWTMTSTMERYGQMRYCTAMPESTFLGDKGSDYCRHHKQADALMEQAEELYKHGYFSTNFVNFAEKLEADKFLFAVEMFGGLLEMSNHDFEVTEEERTIDSTESNMIAEDAVDVALPIPTNDMLMMQANELWTAALKEVMTQNMNEAIFQEGMEKQSVAASEGMEGQITDTITEPEEHHLHLPLSRVAKDIKNHLENGGIVMDDDDGGVVTFQKNDYTLDVSPSESDTDDAESLSETATDFSKQLEAEGVEVEVEN
jgi:hypothetical protein